MAAAAKRTMICHEPHAYCVPPQEEGGKSRAQGDKARAVQGMLLGLVREVEEGEGGDGEGHIGEEEPQPGEIVRDPAAGQRPRDRGNPEHSAEVPHVLASLAGAYDVTDDSLGEGNDGSHPEPLDRPRPDQPPEPLRRPGQNRSHHEHDEPSDEEPASTVDVGELADDRDGHGRHQERGGRHPRVVVDAAQVGHDHGHRGRDDGLARGGDQHPEHEREEDDVPAVLVLAHTLSVFHRVRQRAEQAPELPKFLVTHGPAHAPFEPDQPLGEP